MMLAASFVYGSEPIWLVIVKAVVVFAALLVLTLLTIWFERRIISFMQFRVGPNRHGPFGLLQSLADGLKLAFKEEIIPAMVDKPIYFAAPIIAVTPAFVAFAVAPFGPMVSIFGHKTPLQLTDFNVGVLLVLACSSLAVYGIVLAGWSSGSTYPLLGGLRAAAQMISYEISMGLSIATVFIVSGTLSPAGIVAKQQSLWYILPLLPSFAVYIVSGIAETNRLPFDLPEGEGELVGGYHTEYSSLKFALFFLGEYVNMIGVSVLTATLFLGGWRAPWPITLWSGANSNWYPLIWMVVKIVVMLFFFIWLRGTLPRLRYDQLMALGWKVLVPFSLVWLLLVSFVQALSVESLTWQRRLIYVGIPVVILLIAALLWPERQEVEEEEEEVAPFPVPPMDLVVPPSPRARALASSSARPGGASSITSTRHAPSDEGEE